MVNVASINFDLIKTGLVDDVNRGVGGERGGRGSEKDGGEGRGERRERSERDGRERRGERRERSERDGREEERGEGSERDGREDEGERRERSGRDGREEERGEGSERDGREDEGGREEDGREGERENEDVAQFKLCENYLDICNWLVTKPEILNLTLQMSESKKCSIGAPDPVGPADPVDLVGPSSTLEDKIRLWDESIKCLFLRFQNPPSQILDEIITKIFNVKVYANVAKRYLEKTRKSFTDFRNKFNQNILESVEEYKKIRAGRGTHGDLSTREVREYIDDDVTEKLLSRQLGGVNLQELKKMGDLMF